MLFAVHAHGCHRALNDGGQRQLAVRGELLEIGAVLEKIGIQRSIAQRQIGLHIVVELHQLDLVALLLQLGQDAFLQQVIVGASRRTNQQIFLAAIIGHGWGTCGDQQGHGSSGQNGTTAGVKRKTCGHESLLENLNFCSAFFAPQQ